MRDYYFNRRDFLSTTAQGIGAAAVLGAGARLALAEEKPSPAQPKEAAEQGARTSSFLCLPGKVVQVHHPAAMKSMKKPDEELVGRMVDRAVIELSGRSDLAEAWTRFISPDDVVEIKINCLGKRYNSTNAQTVQAIIRGLRSIGIKPESIFIYDMYGSHMRSTRQKLLRPDGKQVGYAEQWGYEKTKTRHEAGKSRFASILGRVTAVVNVPVMKHHDLSGVTGALKNMSHGHVHNPSRFHRNGCLPGIPEIYAHPKIRDKVRLCIMDGLRLLYHGGPQDSPKHRIVQGRIYASTDPVALDTLLLERVQEARKKGRKRALKEPGFLAAATQLGLGINDRGKIELEEIELGAEGGG